MKDLNEKIQLLKSLGLKGVDLSLNIECRNLTTFRTNVKAAVVATVHNYEALKNILIFFKNNYIDYYILGGGSNTLLAEYLDVTALIKLGSYFNFIEFKNNSDIIAGAGLNLGRFVIKTYKQGYNFSFLAGIPGSLGGAVFGNAGSKNEGICDFIEYIECLRFSGSSVAREKIKIKKQDFGYRFLNIERLAAITSVCFKKEKFEKQLIYNDIVENIKIKKKNQPLSTYNGGCFFKNPLTSIMTAGQLIDRAGLKGFRYNGAKVSAKHANFLENAGSSGPDDILRLSLIVKGIVKEKFNIDLYNEVNTIGFK